ncbi:GCN5-related N-acetyltransferase [Pseudonocardia dioxanivorans CB1190]|uniref:GCN5-related N-acetyltransferase n=1 Tax=Pseudonocardia dioxanivorans (strain ATCC 55486 / DSM 44775 / JCM 13855 / CB1190) TaxID=675635 RepID=F4CW96_PSEUX|nr:GNAT family N-acetyltransferase [Pseudonocardia dioxanivorans]AEA27514.1 GCN5-related N-acetyltransferase [Pseudonocardia dioxanivorans CB1190]
MEPGRRTERLDVRLHDYADPVVAELVEEVQQEYVVRYGGRDDTPVVPAQFRPPDGLVLVAWVDDEPAGCVAIRRAEVADPVGGPVAEMKRLYVRAAHRRNGLARALVRAAEDAAATAGYARLVLETGSRQPESIALYAAEGYEPVAAFGVYAGAPGARHLGKVLRRSPR